jgi:heme oxygenase
MTGGPIAPANALTSLRDQDVFDHGHSRQSAVAVDLHGICVATSDHDLLTRRWTEASENELIGGIRCQRATTLGAQVLLNRAQRTGTFDQQRSDRTASG